MALKKNSKGIRPDGIPVEINQDKPFLFKTDLLIYKKLATKNLDTSTVNKTKISSEESTDLQKILSEAIESYKEEIQLHHSQTVLLFYEYCLNPLHEFFVEKNSDPEKFIRSHELMTFFFMVTGFEKGMNEFAKNMGRLLNPDHKYLSEAIPGLFTEEEFQQIIDSVVYILKNFQTQAKEAHEWLNENIEPEKRQMDAMMNFVQLLSKTDGNYEDSLLKGAAENVIEECMPGKNGEHNVWRVKEREKLGLFSPYKEFLINLERIFNYLDIIHYGQYYVVPGATNPADLKFFHSEFVMF